MLQQLKELKKVIYEQEDSYSNPNYILKESKRFIEASMGIKLILIELVRLKELAIGVTDRYSKNKTRNPGYRFNPLNELTDIFLLDYYGIPQVAPGQWDFLLGRGEFLKKNGYDGYREFWKKRQEQAHLP